MEEKFFELEIITPDRQFYEGKAWFVEMNTSEGNIGVYKNHIPLTYLHRVLSKYMKMIMMNLRKL